MSINIDKLKKAATDLQARMSRGGGGQSMKFWRPLDGRSSIRILPPWTAEGPHAGSFYREVHQHWNVNPEAPGPILCPKNTPHCDADYDCPVCELVDQLRARKNDVSSQEAAKNLRAKAAYLMSVVDLADPTYTAKDVADWKKDRPDSDVPFGVGDVKVQCYAATNTITEQILSSILNSDIDITDLNAGRNVFITKIPNKDKMKTRYTVNVDLKPTVFELPEGFVLPDLSKISNVRKYEDVMKLLSDGVGSQFSAALPESTTPSEGYVENAEVDGAEDLAASMRKRLKR